VLTEAIGSLALLGLLLGLTSLVLTRYARATDYFLNARRAQWAAEAHVERLRSGALPLRDATAVDENGVECTIQVTDAPAAWAPLRQVRVLAVVTGKHGRQARCELTTFVGEEARPEDGR